MLRISNVSQPLRSGGAWLFRVSCDYIRHLQSGRERWLWKWRCRALNTLPGVSVSPYVFFAKTAKLSLNPQGVFYGGHIEIADGVRLDEGVLIVPWGGHVNLGENVTVGPYCVLNGQGGLRIGRDTMIAGHTFIIPGNHSFSDRAQTILSQPSVHLGITIGEDVWIGCGVRILDGVSIGRGCIIGAGAVVTKSLPDYSIAIGVPAKVVGVRGIE